MSTVLPSITKLTNHNTISNYWESKLLNWEKQRYGWTGIFNPASLPIRLRVKKTADYLKHGAHGKSCLDLACGSGQLRAALGKTFPIKYRGIDISENGILKARVKFENWTNTDFSTGNIVSSELPECDYAVMLGITDWLTLSELESVLNRLKSQCLIMSFTLSHNSKTYQWYHRRLRGNIINQDQCFPISYELQEIILMARRCGYNLISVHSHGWGPGRIGYFRSAKNL